MRDMYFAHAHPHRHEDWDWRGRPGRSRRGGWAWAGGPGPWSEADEDRVSLRRSAAALFGAVRQLRTASPEEREEARGILDDARRRLYLLLARETGPTSDVAGGDTPDATAI
jgi:hypothetical protein